MLFSGCEDKLMEENHSKLTPDFFATTQGFETGLNAAYAGLREIYGPEEGLHAFTNTGTDEFRTANGNRTSDVANYNSSYTPGNEFSTRLWNSSYKFINTCNGLVHFGMDIEGISMAEKERMVAEARFLRAQYYFLLVQSFGDVTLNTTFQDEPVTSASKSDLIEVYDFITEDLMYAKSKLPSSPQKDAVLAGKATAAAARHLLAKVYLTYGWVHNKNVYPYENYYDQVKAQQYFELAYDEASKLITDSPGLGLKLLDNFADVHKAGNEANEEVLFSVQYSSDKVFGGGHLLNHFYVNKYENQLGERNIKDGRCYAWFRATPWLLNVAFADKTNDSRYINTFQTVWYATKTTSGEYTIEIGDTEHTLNADLSVIGDTAMVMPGYNMSTGEIEAISQNRGEGKNKFYVFTPETYTDATIFPTMTKFLDPITRVHYNENSHRPVIVYRLADTYLMAAEAALLTNKTGKGEEFINAVRERAAFPGKEADMKIESTDITIDFILDERARELCAEHLRWFDLVRTGKLLERVKLYDDFEATNNIQWFHVLRPIPQSQIDRTITGTPFPQNQGW